ncbi:MAG: FAD-dependent oxidoreductase [Chlamydiales bacterium]
MLHKIILSCLFVTSVFSAEHVSLKTPVISKENIIGTNVGIRPFRRTGVRIEAECVGNKLLIHNYGYGGAGLTLSFGGVLEVIDILENYKITPKTVAILGAGVVGLATAYDLLAKGYEVHIYADEWSPNLTSNVAVGIWSSLSFPKDLPEEKKQCHLRMEKNAEIRFLKSVGDSPEFVGVRIIPSYRFKTQASQESDKVKQGEKIIAHFDNGVIKSGIRTYKIGIDGKLFMNDLYDKVKKNGAVLKQCHFESFEDVIGLEEPIIINCTSMGSIKLFNDHEFIPVRGQLIYFNPQDDIDYLYSHSIDCCSDDTNLFFVFIYPWSDRLILGGVYELNQEEPIVVQSVIDKIMENAEACLSGRL